MLGLGPLWFVALALIFSIGYALWRIASRAVRRRLSNGVRRRRCLQVCVFLVMSVGDHVVLAHGWCRLGRDVSVLFSDVLDLPDTQPICRIMWRLFVHWHRDAPAMAGCRRRPGAGIWQGAVAGARAATIILLPWALSGTFLQLTFSPGAEFTGNGTWQSGLYSHVGLGDGGRDCWWRHSGLFESCASTAKDRSGAFLARQSYAVFSDPRDRGDVRCLSPFTGSTGRRLPSSCLLAVLAVPLSFGIAYVIRLIPGVSKVV